MSCWTPTFTWHNLPYQIKDSVTDLQNKTNVIYFYQYVTKSGLQPCYYFSLVIFLTTALILCSHRGSCWVYWLITGSELCSCSAGWRWLKRLIRFIVTNILCWSSHDWLWQTLCLHSHKEEFPRKPLLACCAWKQWACGRLTSQSPVPVRGQSVRGISSVIQKRST